MWTQLLTSTVIAAAIGAASALAVMYFTPRLQHRFSRRRRQDELRLETANEFNRVITQYSCPTTWGRVDRNSAQSGLPRLTFSSVVSMFCSPKRRIKP